MSGVHDEREKVPTMRGKTLVLASTMRRRATATMTMGVGGGGGDDELEFYEGEMVVVSGKDAKLC